jgi:hypothetical protein
MGGQDVGYYLLENWTENDADLQGEHFHRVEVVIARKVVCRSESSVVANKVTMVVRKDLGCDNGNCLLGDALLADVHLFLANKFELKAVIDMLLHGTLLVETFLFSTLLVETLLLGTLFFETLLLSTLLFDTLFDFEKTLLLGLFGTLLFETLLFGTLFFETLLLSTLLFGTLFDFEQTLLLGLFGTLLFETLLLLPSFGTSDLLSYESVPLFGDFGYIFSAMLLFSFFFGFTCGLFVFLAFSCLLDVVRTIP